MVSRTVLLLWLMTALGVMIIVEQPNGSLMEKHPRMLDWIEKNSISKVPLGFRHLSIKPEGPHTRQ